MANTSPKRKYTKRAPATAAAKPKAAETSAPVATTVQEPPIEAESVQKKTVSGYKPNDLVPCKSITAGRMIYIGPRTRTPYVWVNSGDVAYLEYQDLMSAILSHSDYVYEPLFVIEDEAILSDRRWEELKDLYDNLYDMGDVKRLMNLPLSSFKSELKKAPAGFQNAVKSEIVAGIKSGTFDSIQKVKAADEILGTKMAEML